MSDRMKPVRLTRGPVSGRTYAVRRYRVLPNGVIQTHGGDSSRDDVSADYDAMVLGDLLGDFDSTVLRALADAAEGAELDTGDLADLKTLNNRIVAIVERHNARAEAER